MLEKYFAKDIEDLQREFEGMIRRFFLGQGPMAGHVGEMWRPPTDVLDSADRVVVRMEIAGVSLEDLSLSVSGHSLEVRGVRKFKPLDGDFHFNRAEIYYGCFQQRIHLGENVDRDRATATYQDGLLEIVLPKSTEGVPHEVRLEEG